MATLVIVWRRARRLAYDRSGVTAVEFAMVCPVFFLLLFAIFAVGITGLIQLALDDAVRDAARQLQIDTPASTSAAGLVAAVCSEFALVSPNCTRTLTYNVVAATQTAGFASITPAKLSAAGALPNAFFASGTPFAPNADVLVQVAYPLPFTFPFIGAFATMTGTNSVLATATVRVEPYPQ